MKYWIEQIIWRAARRSLWALKIPGFSASVRTYVDRSSSIGAYSRLHGSTVVLESSIGSYSYATNARVVSARIGNFCSIASEAIVGGAAPHPLERLSTSPAFYSHTGQVGRSFAIGGRHFDDAAAPVVVESNVWIGARALIMPGVTLAEGTIVAAGAVVTRDTGPYSIVGGVPAKRIRTRFKPEVVEAILSGRYFERADDFYARNLALFLVGEEEFYRRLLQGELS